MNGSRMILVNAKHMFRIMKTAPQYQVLGLIFFGELTGYYNTDNFSLGEICFVINKTWIKFC